MYISTLSLVKVGSSPPCPWTRDITTSIYSHIAQAQHDSTHTKYGNSWDRLKEFQTIFLVDNSVTMGVDWAQALAFLGDAVPVCLERSQNDISFFFTDSWTAKPSRFDEAVGDWNAEWPVLSGYLDIRYLTRDAASANGHPEEASAEFVLDKVAPADQPSDDVSTTIAKRLAQILRPYIAAFQAGTKGDERFKYIEQINLIVVTNGGDPTDLKSETLKIAEELIECGAPSSQVGIQFVQIGDSKDCTRHLKDLDSDLIWTDRDMIDTVSYEQTMDPQDGRMTEDGLFKVLLGGVSRKIDVRRLQNGHFLGQK